MLTIGDALCHFIPVFGKGMSVTAEEAVILDRLLAEDLPMKRLARDFFAAIQSTIETPWGVAVTDFVCPATCGSTLANSSLVAVEFRTNAQTDV